MQAFSVVSPSFCLCLRVSYGSNQLRVFGLRLVCVGGYRGYGEVSLGSFESGGSKRGFFADG